MGRKHYIIHVVLYFQKTARATLNWNVANYAVRPASMDTQLSMFTMHTAYSELMPYIMSDPGQVTSTHGTTWKWMRQLCVCMPCIYHSNLYITLY